MRRILITSALACAIPVLALAQDDSPEAEAVKARQGFMHLQATNMAPLAAMAKGEIEYDEAAAVRHAKNLATLGPYEYEMHFIEGTAKGEIENSDALPKIWGNFDDFTKKHMDYADAAAAAPEGVKGGAKNVAVVVQNIGTTCKACHDQYRAK